jgi:pimeloyl-ACP methyl ester carboxylesterase
MLIIAGGRDNIVPLESIERFVALNPGCEYVVLPDADHRMHDNLHVIHARIQEFFTR